jgi:hypothetical protein
MFERLRQMLNVWTLVVTPLAVIAITGGISLLYLVSLYQSNQPVDSTTLVSACLAPFCCAGGFMFLMVLSALLPSWIVIGSRRRW